MKFIKKHLTAIIVTIICLVLLVLAAFAVYRMFYPSSDKSVYGSRVDDAPEITNEVISDIKTKVLDSKIVNTIEYNTSVKTMKFYIDVKDDTKITKAQDLSDIVIENLSEDIIKFYDISIYLTQKTGVMLEYPAIGYHAKESDKFNWVINKEVESSEE